MTGGSSEASLQTVLRKRSIGPRAPFFPADISCRAVDSFPDLLALPPPLFSEGIRIGIIRLFQTACSSCLFQDGSVLWMASYALRFVYILLGFTSVRQPELGLTPMAIFGRSRVPWDILFQMHLSRPPASESSFWSGYLYSSPTSLALWGCLVPLAGFLWLPYRQWANPVLFGAHRSLKEPW